WLGEWSERLVRWQFRRGLLHEATMTPDAWERWGADLVREQPVYRMSFVDDQGDPVPPEAVAGIVACPHLGAIRALDLACGNAKNTIWAHYRGSRANPTWVHALA